MCLEVFVCVGQGESYILGSSGCLQKRRERQRGRMSERGEGEEKEERSGYEKAGFFFDLDM